MLARFLLLAVPVELGDVLVWLLSLAGLVVLVFLSILLAHLIGGVRTLRRIVDQAEEPVVKTTERLPEIADRLSTMSGQLGDSLPQLLDDRIHISKAVRQTVVNVGETTSQAAGAVSGFVSHKTARPSTAESISQAADAVLEVVSVLSDLLSRSAGKSDDSD